jgi:hypothetical protein
MLRRQIQGEGGHSEVTTTRCDDGIVLVICPRCQMVLQDASGATPDVIAYCARGCF